MIPVSFGGCAAWLHEAEGGRGAVLLPAFGFEELCSRHALRCLADRLAAQGVPTLRFDYRSTGDSTGIWSDPDRVAAWSADAEAAIDRLIAVTGVAEVALVGLRLGALLAPSVAARRPEVTRLVLLAPPATGSAYLREMRALSLILGSPPDEAVPGGLSIAGFRMSGATLAELKQVDVARLGTRPADKALVVAPETARGQDAIAERLAALGSDIHRQVFGGYQEMMCDPTAAAVPAAALADIAGWIASDAPTGRVRRPTPAAASIRDDGWSERGIVLDEGGAAGVYCGPAGVARPARAVLMLDAGGIHHHGWARLHVEMARRLAGEGIASLRLDFPGVGDGVPWPGPRRMTFYDDGTRDHVTAALDWLERQGATALTIAGTCSGAHHAFHTAIRDERVTGLVMLNTLCFVWGPSYALPLNAWKMSRPKEMASRQRAAAGEAGSATLVERAFDSSLPLVKRTIRALVEALKTGLAPLARRASAQGGARNAVEAGFQALAARDVRIALVYGEDDPGRTELERHMGPDGAWATDLPGISLHLIADTDHALTPQAARDRYGDILLSFCLNRDDRRPADRLDRTDLRQALS